MKRKNPVYRKFKEQSMRFISILTLLVSLGAMFGIIGTTIFRGISIISWTFLTQPSKPYGIEGSGIANALQGSLYITFMATIIILPAAVAGGIWLAEYGQNSRLGNTIRFCTNVMMGIPSIITGLFIYAVWVVPTGHFSGFAGSLALGIIMFPIILRTTEDMLLLVPNSLREAVLALGINRVRATLQIVCRSARDGLITGIMMAFARVSGETAPLLFTALWSNSWCRHYFTEPTANIPVLMTEYTTNSPFYEQQAAGWGAALVIMIVILILNLLVRRLFNERKQE